MTSCWLSKTVEYTINKAMESENNNGEKDEEKGQYTTG